MAQVVMTWTRQDTSKPWILINRQAIDTGIFTKDEIDIFILTKDVYNSLPGFLNLQSIYVNDNVFKVIIDFDTIENAQNAFSLLQNPPINSAIEIRRKIIANKLLENNLQYNFGIELV